MARKNSGGEGKGARRPSPRRADKVTQDAPPAAPERAAQGKPAVAPESGSQGKPAAAPERLSQSKAASAPHNGGIVKPAATSLKKADTPSPVEVQQRAYELYLQRGGGHGRDIEDWLEAERQVRRQQGKGLA